MGFRFAPTDEELIDNYLKPKILGMDSKVENIPEVDICKWDPWELPGKLSHPGVLSFNEHACDSAIFFFFFSFWCVGSSVMKADDPEWFFFSLLDYKYSKGSRSNRTTKAGYWKPTGKDRDILSGTNKEVIGTKKTLVFYIGRSPAATRTNWVIHEYRTDIAGLPAKVCYITSIIPHTLFSYQCYLVDTERKVNY